MPYVCLTDYNTESVTVLLSKFSCYDNQVHGGENGPKYSVLKQCKVSRRYKMMPIGESFVLLLVVFTFQHELFHKGSFALVAALAVVDRFSEGG